MVLEGMELITKVESVKTNNRDTPEVEIKIVDAGSLPVDKPFIVAPN